MEILYRSINTGRRLILEKVILYTSHCPKCKILTEKLNSKGICYEEITDINIMIKKGFDIMPILEVNDKIMSFVQANKWINEFKQEEFNEN